MFKTLAPLALAASLGLASAGTVTLHDSGFDYADSDLETAYVQLDYRAGELVVTLADELLDGSLPAIAVAVPGPAGVDLLGNDRLPDYEDLGLIGWQDQGRDLIGFSVTHEDADLDAVVAAYLDVLWRLGFDAALESDSMNAETYLLTQDDETIRAIFAHTGTGPAVTAYLRFR